MVVHGDFPMGEQRGKLFKERGVIVAGERGNDTSWVYHRAPSSHTFKRKPFYRGLAA